MAVNKNPGSRDDNRGKFRGPSKTHYRGSNVPLADEEATHTEAGSLRERPDMPDRVSGERPMAAPDTYRDMPDRITADYANKGRKQNRGEH